MGLLDRLLHRDSHIVASTVEQPTVVQIDASALSRASPGLSGSSISGCSAGSWWDSASSWSGRYGCSAWTSTITEPVLVGAILATVAGPLVSKMKRRREFLVLRGQGLRRSHFSSSG